ncbi:hypothetical protein [Deinococcus aquatilis]|uniref:hypothetical protein n=1 Tax=Deinococcus aquatilis TaxID=519440 RepID=UPI00036F5697|nr:hypothetical protein [Deinococcus aquatilis]
MTKKTPAKPSRLPVVNERIMETLNGPVLNVRFRRKMPDGPHRDLTPDPHRTRLSRGGGDHGHHRAALPV